MRKSYNFILIILLFFVLGGCENTMNQSTLTITFDNQTTVTTIITDNRHLAIDEEYQSLSSKLPFSLTDDFLLPSTSNSSIQVEYLLDDQVITNQILEYEKLAYDKEIVLVLRFSYDGVTVTKNFIIIQIRDEALYNQSQIDQVFESTLENVELTLPKTINSDFTLPTFDIPGIKIRFSVPEKYKILNNRFIYPFPTEMESLYLNVKITYQNQIRVFGIPITMIAYSDLPKIPEIHINTLSNAQINSNEDYVSARLTLKTFDENNVELTPISNVSMQIRLRGNSTMWMPKKPYKLKFATKTALLSEYAQKDWVLLANYTDQTLIRNYLAYNFARDIDMDFTPMAKFVDVYLNGAYQGNYLLTDQIEVSPNRVNIEEGSSGLDTGYLLEFDKRILEFENNHSYISDNYFKVYGIPFAMKSPSKDDSHYTENQMYFIQDYIKTVFDTLYARKDYSKLIDEETFIDWFIVEEVFKNVDSGYSSVFLYKDKGGLLKMGPVWDFDLSTGNQGHEQDPYTRGPEGWYTSQEYKNIMYFYLMKYPTFRQNLKTRWNEIYETEIITLLDKVYAASDSITRSRYDNFIRWDIIGKNYDWYTAPEVYAIDNYEGQVLFLYDYLDIRIEWLNTEINKF